MPRQRDYREEYRRRIQRGLEKGLTRSQASGHPVEGETPASKLSRFNPFTSMKRTVNRMVSGVRDAFQKLPFVQPSTQPVEYMEQHDQSGITILPRWSTGSEEEPPSRGDIRDTFYTASEKRFQFSYAIVICGVTEEPYPTKEGEINICLSYRIAASTISRALDNPENKNIIEVINAMLPDDRYEEWIEIHSFQIIDKE